MNKAQFKAWRVVVIASLFFFYEFIQMNMMNSISVPLMQTFSIPATMLGVLSSCYFLANVIFLFVAGALLDRFPTRRVILMSLGVCVLGTFCFVFATTFWMASLCRFLTGIGSAFCFLSVLRLASRWFPAERMALVTGVVVTVAMTGGMVSQTPLAMLVAEVGWRHALLYDAALGVLIYLLVLCGVDSHPPEESSRFAAEQEEIRRLGYLKTVRMAFLNKQNWFAGVYTSAMNLPVNVLGGLWGSLFLTRAHHLTTLEAADVAMMLFVGVTLGSPLIGWLSDRQGKRRPLMLWGALAALLVTIATLYLKDASFGVLLLLFLGLGFICSAQIIGYPLVAEGSERVVTAMSVSVVNITTISGIGLSQILFGHLMDAHALHRLHHASTSFVASDFSWAMLLFPLGYAVAWVAAYLAKETYCSAKI